MEKILENMLNRAIKVASENYFNKNRYNLCAIITDKKNKIISVGCNSYKKSHPTQAYFAEKVGQDNRIFLHAELDALIKIPYGKKPYSIFVARVNKKGKSLLAKPCPICSLAIKDAGIKNIYYTE